MEIKNNIRKRINAIANINGLIPGKIIISEQEAKELGNIKEIDGVKLIVERRDKMTVKEDCFAYDQEHKDCTALNDLYCKKENCRFYKNKKQISKADIERSVRNYSLKNNI